ncbi:MAG TPA: DNA (cytosine-5-)-methyltransferase [Candidatus Sulfotelmatobacter sp.]|jgi:DNA (cytosine-5)-methyltransferase 1|nr:DNA (cytosine-5-)-methyltransferase [Candidatus Sulfotelmatobacter sp.]
MAHNLTFVDLFCGIGGMRLGFEQAGCKCVFSSDWDKYAQQTYAANFEETPVGNIRDVDARSIPQHDILVGGFPCQPFSISGVSKKNSLGREHGFADKIQGTLFFEVARIINERRPSAFLLENVKHLVRHGKGRTMETILETLSVDLGYHVYEPRVLDAKHLVPQHRERVFILGFREPRSFQWPRFGDRGPVLKDILDKRVPEKYTLSDHLWNYLQRYAEKHKAAGNGFGFGLISPEGIARTLSARYYKDGSEILVPQPKRNPRRLTPRECARLMGFPESFKIPVSDTQAYKQFGNSVVVPMIARLAKQLVKSLEGPVEKDTTDLPSIVHTQYDLVTA